ncbi:hypothetical protein B0H21DRAFT_705847 [Amylocystis lapponica]|nr:hypothetical protein B0H21DRAFT_705847 [Amylocystis lapponica]
MAPNIQLTVGALLLGTLITAVGFGITTVQTYLYMTRFPNDHKIIRWTVWSLLILDTTHVTLTWHMIYYYLILNYNNPPALEEAVWSFDTTIVITAVITVIAHCGPTKPEVDHRNYHPHTVGPQVGYVHIIGALSFVQYPSFEQYSAAAEVGIGIGSGTIADCIITVSLVFYLRKQRTGFNRVSTPIVILSRTDSLLDKIAFWTVNNGMLTSIVGIVVVVTLLSMPYNMVYLSVHLLLSKLYANALLATLNFRRAHRGRGLDEDAPTSVPLSALRAVTPRTSTSPTFGEGEDRHGRPRHDDDDQRHAVPFRRQVYFPLRRLEWPVARAVLWKVGETTPGDVAIDPHVSTHSMPNKGEYAANAPKIVNEAELCDVR